MFNLSKINELRMAEFSPFYNTPQQNYAVVISFVVVLHFAAVVLHFVILAWTGISFYDQSHSLFVFFRATKKMLLQRECSGRMWKKMQMCSRTTGRMLSNTKRISRHDKSRKSSLH